jgi:chromosome segregation ATPase
MARRSESSVENSVDTLFDAVASVARKAEEANGDAFVARLYIGNALRSIAGYDPANPEDAEELAEVREELAERREELREAHAARIAALEAVLSEAHRALAMLKLRDPEPTDTIPEQPEGDEMGLVWAGGTLV